MHQPGEYLICPADGGRDPGYRRESEPDLENSSPAKPGGNRVEVEVCVWGGGGERKAGLGRDVQRGLGGGRCHGKGRQVRGP